MNLLDFILNLAALLLWLNWLGIAPSAPVTAAALSAPPRQTARRARWHYLLGLVILLTARAIFYWQAGPPLGWTPGLALGPTRLFLRSDYLSRMLLYSALSFGAALGVFYLFLLVLSMLPGTDASASFVRRHLGPFGRWPAIVKWLLPLLLMTAVWFLLNPLLFRIHLVPAATPWRTLAQGALLGVSFYLALKFLLIGFFLLHLLNSYIYLGESPFWSFVNTTSSVLLRPLRVLPLRVGRVDLAPALALTLVLLAAQFGQRGLDRLYPLI